MYVSTAYIINRDDYDTIEEAEKYGAVRQFDVCIDVEFESVFARDAFVTVQETVAACSHKLTGDKSTLQVFFKHPKTSKYLTVSQTMDASEKAEHGEPA